MLGIKGKTPDAAPAKGPAAGVGVIPPAPMLEQPKRQPKRLMIAAGVLVAVIGALAAYFVSQRATERVEVVAVAQDVAWGQQVQEDDLLRVPMVADPGLTPVPWSQAASLVGQYATGPLRAGSLFVAESVAPERLLEDGQALIGVAVKAGQMPIGPLEPGDSVQLVTTPEQNSDEEPPAPVMGTVHRTGTAVSGGFVPVDVVVPQGDAARLASDSALGHVVVVLMPRG